MNFIKRSCEKGKTNHLGCKFTMECWTNMFVHQLYQHVDPTFHSEFAPLESKHMPIQSPFFPLLTFAFLKGKFIKKKSFCRFTWQNSCSCSIVISLQSFHIYILLSSYVFPSTFTEMFIALDGAIFYPGDNFSCSVQ